MNLLQLLPLLLSLLAASTTTAAFPNGRCYVKSCESSPYELRATAWQPGRLCFRIAPKTCAESSATHTCCQRFRDNLNKIVLRTSAECNRSVSAVTINGIRKGGGVFFDTYAAHSELRITSLGLNNTSASSTEVCVNLTGTCSTPVTFCGNTTGCAHAVFDPFGHTCCPTCQLLAPAATPPAPPPPPPRSRPSSPRQPPAPASTDAREEDAVMSYRVTISNSTGRCQCEPLLA